MITCKNYKPINKNTLLGVANIYSDKWDLHIYGITLHQKNGKRWINFPSRKVEGEDGKTEYLPYFRIESPQNYEKFCEAVKQAIETWCKENLPPNDENTSDIIPNEILLD